MNIAGQIPPDWTISWIRAYDLGDLAHIAPRALVATGGAGTGADVVDVDEQAFFDIQTLRFGHVARLRLPGLRFDGTLRLAAGERPVAGRVRGHLLVHSSGFMVVRLTLRADRLEYEGPVTAEVLGQLERAMWVTGYPLRWHVPQGRVVEGNVRCAMNWIFLDFYERAHGRPPGAHIAEWASEGIQGCEKLHELYREGYVGHPFPVSFGAQFEIVNPRLSPLAGAMDREREWQGVIDSLMFPGRGDIRAVPVALGRETLDRWYLTENQALTLLLSGAVDEETDVMDPDRTQLLEYLTLRRAALRCVQRDTQRVLTERLTITRAQLERWQHMVASTTDDYVLHDRVGQLIEPIRGHYTSEILLRDLGDLERQVRANLTWFQERLDTLSDWTGGLVGASVGAAAMVLSLQESIKGVLGDVLGGGPEKVLANHPWEFAGTMLALMVLSFGLALTLIRRMTSRLNPFSAPASTGPPWGRRRAPRSAPPS
ncbi:hypothetical protein ACSNOI_45200 [Actinomadura kijaniata]|uniref:hypothetical protein n=1 Tax=Actinomadura kijaniata TaxID=46161 RepID=UPI003F1D3398